MPLPNILGTSAANQPSSSGLPNILGGNNATPKITSTKVSGLPNILSNTSPTPTVAPTPAPKLSFWDAPDNSALGITKNTITGLPKALWDTLGPGKIQDYLKTPEGQNAAANLSPSDVRKSIAPAIASVPLQLASDISGQDINLKSSNPNLANDIHIKSVQNATREAVLNGENPYEAIIKAVPQVSMDALMVAGLSQKVFSPRTEVIGVGYKKNILQPGETAVDKSFRLTNPDQVKNFAIPKEVLPQLEQQGIKLSGYDETQPVYARTTLGLNGKVKLEIVQIKPSFAEQFFKIFKGNPTKVPETGLTIVASHEKAANEISVVPTKTEVSPAVPSEVNPVSLPKDSLSVGTETPTSQNIPSVQTETGPVALNSPTIGTQTPTPQVTPSETGLNLAGPQTVSTPTPSVQAEGGPVTLHPLTPTVMAPEAVQTEAGPITLHSPVKTNATKVDMNALPEELNQRAVQLEIQKDAIMNSPLYNIDSRTVFAGGSARDLGDIKNPRVADKIQKIMAEVGINEPKDFAAKLEEFQARKKQLAADQ